MHNNETNEDREDGRGVGQLLKFHCISIVHFGVNNQDLTRQKSLIYKIPRSYKYLIKLLRWNIPI
jgi:hypothetical protein